MQDPELKEFKSLYHDFVLFDEATTDMVLKYKKLFQSNASWVVCGSSSTNMYAYHPWFHKVRIIVASNTWSEEIKRLPLADANWLMENSVYVSVDQPLWEPDLEPFAKISSSCCTQTVLPTMY